MKKTTLVDRIGWDMDLDVVYEKEEAEREQASRSDYSNVIALCPPNCGSGSGGSRVSIVLNMKDIPDDFYKDWKGERKEYAKLARLCVNNPKAVGVVIKEDGEIKAIAAISKSSRSGNVLVIDAAATKEMGYGLKLFRACCQVAADKQSDLVLVSAPKSVGFYRRIGMKEIDKGYRTVAFSFKKLKEYLK